MARGGVVTVVDTKDLSKLGRDLRRAAPDVWLACHKALREAAEPVREDAVARVNSWARVNPSKGHYGPQGFHHSGEGVAASIRIRVLANGVEVAAGGAAAPEAAPIENHGKGFVRHPTFGHRDRFTALHSHPAYLTPAYDKFSAVMEQRIEDAVIEATERAVRGI